MRNPGKLQGKGESVPRVGLEWWQEFTTPKIHNFQNSQFLKFTAPKTPNSQNSQLLKVSAPRFYGGNLWSKKNPKTAGKILNFAAPPAAPGWIPPTWAPHSGQIPGGIPTRGTRETPKRVRDSTFGVFRLSFPLRDRGWKCPRSTQGWGNCPQCHRGGSSPDGEGTRNPTAAPHLALGREALEGRAGPGPRRLPGLHPHRGQRRRLGPGRAGERARGKARRPRGPV